MSSRLSMISSKLAAPISSHQSLTTCKWLSKPKTASQVRKPATASGDSSTSAHNASLSANNPASRSTALSSLLMSSSIQSSSLSVTTRCKPKFLKQGGANNIPSSVNRARHLNLVAPSASARPNMNRSKFCSACGPPPKQSWPMRNSTRIAACSATQTANADPFSVPKSTDTRTSDKSVGAAAESGRSPKPPTITARNSAAVSSSAPLPARNSSREVVVAVAGEVALFAI
mmetsp:Transcript_13732/g.34818  ORF Transcript_13732/g.34818 Transcript_13732/m.34818 type:complete len:230 (+) Transcript_13732:92-781(+)